MIDQALKELIQKAEAEMPALIEKASKKLYHHEFADFDCSTLHKMTPKELAAWQAKYPMDSPQYIIALQEWNRRSTADQIKSVRFTTIITAGASIIAAILGAWAGATWTRNLQQNQTKSSIVESYKPPSESKDAHPTINKTEPLPIEKKIK